MLTLKTKKETITELAHIDVYNNNGDYMGYIIKNDSSNARVDENWNFVPKRLCGIAPMDGKTKKALIDKINLHY